MSTQPLPVMEDVENDQSKTHKADQAEQSVISWTDQGRGHPLLSFCSICFRNRSAVTAESLAV